MDAITIRSNGKAEIAYVGATPWHGLGEQLERGAKIERWQVAAGMDWKVQRSKVRYAIDRDGTMLEIPDRIVQFRSDNNAPLGIVSDGFKTVQPKQVLEFFRDTAEANGLELETAGTLFGGRRYWAMARLPQEFKLKGNDVLRAFVLLATACDGSMHTTGKYVNERVVCHNTLSMAMSERGAPCVKVRHSTTFNETKMKIDLGLADKAWATFIDQARVLSEARIAPRQAQSILVDALGDVEEYELDLKAMGFMEAFSKQPRQKALERIFRMFDSGDTLGGQLASSRGTAWGLVNAATQYFDHEQGKDQSIRLASSWFGVNDQLKTAVLQSALKAVA